MSASDRSTSPAQRATFAAFALAMAAFAWLQLNDPDPALWVAVYALTAGVFTLAACGHSHRVLTWLNVALLGALALSVAPGFFDWMFEHDFESITGTMSPDKPYIEETREFLGLVIALALLAVLVAWPPNGARRS